MTCLLVCANVLLVLVKIDNLSNHFSQGKVNCEKHSLLKETHSKYKINFFSDFKKLQFSIDQVTQNTSNWSNLIRERLNENRWEFETKKTKTYLQIANKRFLLFQLFQMLCIIFIHSLEMSTNIASFILGYRNIFINTKYIFFYVLSTQLLGLLNSYKSRYGILLIKMLWLTCDWLVTQPHASDLNQMNSPCGYTPGNTTFFVTTLNRNIMQPHRIFNRTI